MASRLQKITFREMREMGVRGILARMSCLWDVRLCPCPKLERGAP
jgi:hypothetical protein